MPRRSAAEAGFGVPNQFINDIFLLLAADQKGPHFLTQQAAGWMHEGSGRIVAVTSISAFAVCVNRSEYCISKAGLSMSAALRPNAWPRTASRFSRSARHRAHRDDPPGGEILRRADRRRAVPQPRMGEGRDVAKAVRAIADGLLDYSTGSVLNVDGGFHLRSL